MKKTIDLSKEALTIYDNWGHKKSEKVSQAIIEYEAKEQGQVFSAEQENRIREIIKEEK